MKACKVCGRPRKRVGICAGCTRAALSPGMFEAGEPGSAHDVEGVAPVNRLGCLAYVVGALAVVAAGVELLQRATSVERNIAVHEESLQRLNRRLERLEIRAAVPPTAVDLAPLVEQLDACDRRTEHLHFTLETLITVFPGRARLPEPPEGWPVWPAPASHLGSAMPRIRGMTEGELAAMRKEWSRP